MLRQILNRQSGTLIKYATEYVKQMDTDNQFILAIQEQLKRTEEEERKREKERQFLTHAAYALIAVVFVSTVVTAIYVMNN
jgi:hypothetical protein